MNIFKNKFLLILLISAVTLGVLIFGAMTLYKDNDLVFSSDGYIIEATAKSNTKYYFSANTKYKTNVEDKIVFDDVDSNQVAVEPASFVHYSNGDVTFLKKGALVNLTELNSSLINYYNITNQTTIKYNNGNYVVSSNNKEVDIKSFIGRISDSKYLISGDELRLRIPQTDEVIPGEYFEILFIEDGIIKIDNEKASYQVTAQDSYVYVGSNITINLGTGKISYEDDVKMLMSQITISGDENIDLDFDKNANAAGGGGGGGSGSGTGDGDGDGTGEGTEGDGIGTEGEAGEIGEAGGEGDGIGTGAGGEAGEAGGEGDGTGESVGTEVTASLQVELIEAIVTSTTIDLSLQLNNAELVTGNLLYYFTNLSTGKREGNSSYIDLVNGTFNVSQESFSPSTDYSFTIVETDGNSEKQYFQKTFRTKELGITLEKIYATDGSLAYKLNFDENTEVTKARVSIKGAGNNKDDFSNEIVISKDQIVNDAVFEGLKSNTTYAVSVDMVWINNAAYSDVYSINRMDATLKQTPIISGVKVDANSEEIRFDIKLQSVSDPDKSIISYIYEIFLADDITVDNPNPVVQYSVTKNDSDDLVLNLNEINELKTGVDYRCKISAQYDDNEMIREVSTEYSGNFLIKSKPNISFELKSATMNKVSGTLNLIDANCTVPFSGRTCNNINNSFTLRYYKSSEDEHNLNDKEIYFNPSTLSSELVFNDLESNTTYAVKLFGSYHDDDGIIHESVQLGDTFFIKTDKSDNIYFEVIGDNESDKVPGEIVTFDAKLTAPQDSNIMNEISTITLNLYSGRYNVKDKLIGTYKITEKNIIEDLFNNQTITNSWFTDVTGRILNTPINTLAKLIAVTNNMTGTLNNAYTVEVADVYDSTGKNKITVEDPVYTFLVTPTYYLDARIKTNPDENYITVTPITKGNLTEEEYGNLSKDVSELDSLNDDTVVGLIIENSLSDIFVDSAFSGYEKVTVNYKIYNNTTNVLVKTLNVDMGNKYQPKEQIVYFDSSELDDGKEHLTRGYKYKIGFDLDFITEDGSNPHYENEALYKIVSVERQNPIYTQYIYKSNDEGITYRYSFSDIDSALYDKNFYYTLGEKTDKYYSVKKSLIVDGNYHEVTLPIDKNSEYKLYYARKNTDNKQAYVDISNYIFEKEYKYDNSVSYSIVDDNSNILKLRLEKNDYNSRAYAYKVTIKASGVDTYTRYFLASKLGLLKEETGQFNDKGEAIYTENKYIGIDFANIIDFMGHEMEIEVLCYYDSGLVGINQTFNHGLIIKNNEDKFLNTYYQGKDNAPTSSADASAMGIYHIRDGFKVGDSNIFIYNHLVYKPSSSFNGVATGIENEKNLNLDYYGINYDIDYTQDGIVLTNGKNTYVGYNFRVLNGAILNTTNNKYSFDTIIPSISVSTNNTINSIKLNINPSGIYGNNQFIKDGKVHNIVYVNFYKDAEMTEKLVTKQAKVNINSTNSGVVATIDQVIYNNLVPATTYYYTVTAYINNQEVRLFDTDIINNKKSYKAVDYQTSTLDAKGLLNSFSFSVKPTAYNGDYAMNSLSWKLDLKNTENYRIRFELYKPDGTTTEINSETGEEIVVPKYKVVNFDGTETSNCNINNYGTSTNGYINGCYINVKKENVSTIDKKENIYKFSNNEFVFGGNYYKLVVYAVPYTNNSYDENNKLVLYQNDSLSTTGKLTIDGVTYNITIPKLEEPSISLSNSLEVGYSGGYYISFTPTITDIHKVIKNGTYIATLKTNDGNIVGRESNITVGANKKITFNNLKSNSLYYIELSYEIYRNNVGFSDSEKTRATPFTDFTYTPISSGVTLGTITARYVSGKSIILTYDGSSNLSKNISQVSYTISLKGGSSNVNGTFTAGSSNGIFTFGSDDQPRLVIDVSNTDNSDNPGFTFKTGGTYIITTHYYDKDGNEVMDLETNNGAFTTILNLSN